MGWYVEEAPIFDFDNIAAQKGNTLTTVFSASTITETIKVTSTGITKATMVTTFPAANQIKTVLTVYDDSGQSVIHTVTNVANISTSQISEVFS